MCKHIFVEFFVWRKAKLSFLINKQCKEQIIKTDAIELTLFAVYAKIIKVKERQGSRVGRRFLKAVCFGHIIAGCVEI